MVSMFIHFFPEVISWLIRWSPYKVLLVWPGIFGLSSNRPNTSVSGLATAHQVFPSAVGLYFMWWSVYGAWLLLDGCKWAQRYEINSALAVHSPLISKIFGINKDSQEWLAVGYLSLHATGSMTML